MLPSIPKSITQNSAQSGTESSFKFLEVGAESEHFPSIEKVFTEMLAPIYGEQDTAIRRLKRGVDRTCEVLLVNGSPAGAIVYKKEPKDIHKLINSFEIKNLFLLNPEVNCRKGYRTKLLERIEAKANEKLASGIHVIVSEIEDELLNFFKKKGFSEKLSWDETHVDGKKDLLLWKRIHSSPILDRSSSSSTDILGFKRKRECDSDESVEGKVVKYIKAEVTASVADQSHLPVARPGSLTTARPACELRPSWSHSSHAAAPGVDRRFHIAPGSHELTLRKMYIHQIRSGLKTVEGRIFSGPVLRYKEGDQIRFFYQANPQDDVRCKILKVQKFRTFQEMLNSCGVKALLPEVRSLEEGVRIYNSIPNYAERAAKSGVAAIHLEVIK